jgi:hypothetical protein
MFTLLILACLSADDDEETSFVPSPTSQEADINDWWTLPENTYAQRIEKEKARKAWAKLQRMDRANEVSYARRQGIAYNKSQAYWREQENNDRIMYALSMGSASQQALASGTISTYNAIGSWSGGMSGGSQPAGCSPGWRSRRPGTRFPNPSRPAPW